MRHVAAFLVLSSFLLRLTARVGYTTQPPPAYRLADTGAVPSFDASLSPPPPSSVSSSLFSLEPYKRYFDVDTADVLHRLRLACIPFGSAFATTVHEKPDLYGPLWIAATLVFLSSTTGNLAAYFAYVQKLKSDPTTSAWSYDIEKARRRRTHFHFARS